MNTWNHLRKIQSRLADEISKQIFLSRLSYSITDDYDYIQNIVQALPEGKIMAEPQNKAYIFGCGYYGKKLRKALPCSWQGFIDNNYQIRGGYIDGLKIFGPEEIPRDSYVYVVSKYHYAAMINQLQMLGFEQTKVMNIGKVISDMAKRQYFDLAALPEVEHECFIDAGALNGDTSIAFLQWAGKRAQHVFCFEPDDKNAEKCRGNLESVAGRENITVIQKAVWSHSTRLHFDVRANGTSSVADKGIEVEATSIDEIVGDDPVTFIKMDVEGAEEEALKGSECIIRTNKPKLAISVYHKPEDILEIPELILSYRPDYRFYLRHYCLFDNETVLYAV